MSTEHRTQVPERLRRLAWLLDSSIPLPGGFTIGIDALIGLIPGLGDVIGVVLSSYIVREAAQLGLPKSVLVRMVFNVAIEGVVGIVPLFGDLFDAGWKANQRNVRLLGAWLDNPQRTRASSRYFVTGMLALLVALFAATSIAGFLVVRWLWHTLSA
jgi:hypothetical protein